MISVAKFMNFEKSFKKLDSNFLDNFGTSKVLQKLKKSKVLDPYRHEQPNWEF